MISTTEVKLRGLSGSCIYAYELAHSSSCQQLKPSLLNNNNNNTIEAGDQTITDIQRSEHSSKSTQNTVLGAAS